MDEIKNESPEEDPMKIFDAASIIAHRDAVLALLKEIADLLAQSK